MKQIALRYGIWMFLGLTGFFLLMHLLNLSENHYLRIFNGVIHGSCLWLALRTWYYDRNETSYDYTSGVALGIFTTTVGLVPFTIFIAIFLAYNPSFMESLRHQSSIGEYLTPVMASLFIVMEGIVVSLILSYIIARVLEAMHDPV